MQKAPVIMRRAEFWIGSSGFRCEGEGGESVYGRTVVKDRSDKGEIEGEEEFTITTVFWVREKFEDVEGLEGFTFSEFDMRDPRMASVEEETQDFDGE